MFGVTTPAQAKRALRVRVNDCSGWAADELERLTHLELATVGGGESDSGTAELEITCDQTGADLRARDPRTQRWLSRRVELATDAEDGARVLAISAAQLVRALDWLPESPARPQAATTRTAPSAARSSSASSRRLLELQLAGGPRTRDLASPFVTYRLAIGSAREIRSGVSLGGAFNYERGDAERSLGRVQTELMGAALQANFEPWRGKRWSCLWRAELGLNRLRLRGKELLLGTSGAQVSGFGGEAHLALGPVLRSARFGVALLVQGGGSYFGGEGLVSGDESVNLDGAWAGLELAMLWAP